MTVKKTYNIRRGIFIVLIGVVVSVIAGIITYFICKPKCVDNAFVCDIFAILSFLIGIVLSLLAGYIALFYDFADFIEKITKDLEATHGIITPYDSKLAITAKITPFYDEPGISPSVKESFDLIRHYTYQDLILSPKYLLYFFKRIEQPGTHYRIIVVKDACQASLIYIKLSCLAGYKTYIISDEHFESSLSRSCISNKRLNEIFKKGNPYIEKISDAEYIGRYSKEDETIEIIPDKKVSNAYGLLECIRDSFCREIKKDNVDTIGDLTVALQRKKNEPTCSKPKHTCPLRKTSGIK